MRSPHETLRAGVAVRDADNLANRNRGRGGIGITGDIDVACAIKRNSRNDVIEAVDGREVEDRIDYQRQLVVVGAESKPNLTPRQEYIATAYLMAVAIHHLVGDWPRFMQRANHEIAHRIQTWPCTAGNREANGLTLCSGRKVKIVFEVPRVP